MFGHFEFGIPSFENALFDGSRARERLLGNGHYRVTSTALTNNGSRGLHPML